MPILEVQRHFATPPELEPLEKKIIAQRSEYAAWDVPEYQHIYLGFIEEGIENLIEVLDREVSTFREKYPTATFTLEYHPSCINHKEYPFQIYSFTLIKKIITPEGQKRQLMIMSWKVPHQDDYRDENVVIESFMADSDIEAYDDGSEVPCKIEPAAVTDATEVLHLSA